MLNRAGESQGYTRPTAIVVGCPMCVLVQVVCALVSSIDGFEQLRFLAWRRCGVGAAWLVKAVSSQRRQQTPSSASPA